MHLKVLGLAAILRVIHQLQFAWPRNRDVCRSVLVSKGMPVAPFVADMITPMISLGVNGNKALQQTSIRKIQCEVHVDHINALQKET